MSDMSTTEAANRPYVLQRDEGVHHHFLDNLATTKVSGGEDATLSAVEFVAPQGFGPPLHHHDDEDEIIVVLDGEVAFRSGEHEMVAAGGATAYLPRRVPHTFQVLSDSARILSITASTGGAPRFDAMVAALGVPVDEPTLPDPMDIDPGHVAQVCGAHGVEILGPPPPPLH
jgi:quercetin dioxygenase-like cupin family protein